MGLDPGNFTSSHAVQPATSYLWSVVTTSLPCIISEILSLDQYVNAHELEDF